MTGLQILVLVIADSRRDDVVDALMSLDLISGFTMTPAMGFSAQHSQFSVREQVEGYRTFARFEILLDATTLEPVLETLADAAGSESSRYWVAEAPVSGDLQHRHRPAEDR